MIYKINISFLILCSKRKDMYKIQQFQFNLFQENTIVLSGKGDGCVVVDPGYYTDGEKEQFFNFLSDNRLEPKAVLVTHGHADHTYGVAALQQKYGCPVYLDREDVKVMKSHYVMMQKLGLRPADISFSFTGIGEGSIIEAAGFTFRVIETPGHTPGGVCFHDEEDNFLLTGDTLFAGTIGRTDMEFGDYDKEIVSIMEKLMLMDADITIYPGHGPSSTIGYERMNDPFLEPFNEKEEEGTENI